MAWHVWPELHASQLAGVLGAAQSPVDPPLLLPDPDEPEPELLLPELEPDPLPEPDPEEPELDPEPLPELDALPPEEDEVDPPLLLELDDEDDEDDEPPDPEEELVPDDEPLLELQPGPEQAPDELPICWEELPSFSASPPASSPPLPTPVEGS